jgi:GNAT superfamily N-acetyltransferase
MEYFKGDYNNKSQVNSIIKIADKYNFYKEDIHINLTGKIHPESKKKYPSGLVRMMEAEVKKNSIGYDKKFIIARTNNRIIAFAFWDYSVEKFINCCSFHFLFVLPEYRNKGIATTLMQKFNKWCDDNNRDTVEVDFSTEETNLVGFYDKFGFKFIPLMSLKKLDKNLITLFKSKQETINELNDIIDTARKIFKNTHT